MDIQGYGKSLYSSESEAMEILRNGRTLEKQKLAEEIKNLRNEKDIAFTETQQLIKCVGDAENRLESIKKELAILEGIIVQSGKETREFVSYCLSVLQDSRQKLIIAKEAVENVEKQAVKATESLISTQNEAKTIHEAILKEGLVMDKQRNDLDIYHDRLKAYFEKYLPDQKIVL